jgi:nitrate reductase gamma subunit
MMYLVNFMAGILAAMPIADGVAVPVASISEVATTVGSAAGTVGRAAATTPLPRRCYWHRRVRVLPP